MLATVAFEATVGRVGARLEGRGGSRWFSISAFVSAEGLDFAVLCLGGEVLALCASLLGRVEDGEGGMVARCSGGVVGDILSPERKR